MNEPAIRLIINYMDEVLFEPEKDWPSYWFAQRTYSRWAANEILERVMDHPLTAPDLIIVEFMLKMEYFISVSKDKDKSCIFSIAKETAEDILQLFL